MSADFIGWVAFLNTHHLSEIYEKDSTKPKLKTALKTALPDSEIYRFRKTVNRYLQNTG